jgi:hypothetical protein
MQDFSRRDIRHPARLVRKCLDGLVYAGITGSSIATDRRRDIDIIAIVSGELAPVLIRPESGVSILAFDTSWLDYQKHMEEPTVLIPSILSKSIVLSRPLVGHKGSINLPRIRSCEADFINVKIKKDRLRDVYRKKLSCLANFRRAHHVNTIFLFE